MKTFVLCLVVLATLFTGIKSAGAQNQGELAIIQTPYPTVNSQIVDTDTVFSAKVVFRTGDMFTTTKEVFGVTYKGTLKLSLESFIEGSVPEGSRVGFLRVLVGPYPALIPVLIGGEVN